MSAGTVSSRPEPPRIKNTHARWLDAAGIHEPALRAAFEECRKLHADFGRTYYLATLLLPPAKRPYVNSLYGFARYADEIVDNGDPDTRADTLINWSYQALAGLRRGESTDPVCRALLHTMRVWDIRAEHIEAFLASMLMDLNVTEYPAYTDLQTYMYGSAAVIGLEMTPILEPCQDGAYERAHALGEAFQLTNFIRDIAEDLDRGRLYLPLEDLAAFGVTREELEARVVTPRIRELLRYEIHRTRRIYTFAAEGIDMLAPSSRDCIRTALALYGGILDEIERADHQVFDRRAAVSLPRRLRVALPAYLRARRQWEASAP
ncbi:phytoene/squalene synthase family protein [Streptomyces phyllanthi]|uniref:Phytoene/squalene synthase family protein n=1 Tax=Streptomyces phyllanthi TaxID=1803180 RepID=A0A5N8W251_9ACTN|nr:phytoene/squalene synthase family protein [Streptomyces phyllanthi]MPY40966.1 phytoene/squalene synthase family protein [Streptomyces phyllanthi]